jgi:small subunit ribosomal protein S18
MAGAGKMRVDNDRVRRSLTRSLLFSAMTTPEQPKPRSLTPAEIPFTSPHMFNRCITDTGKILPRKYTGLTSKHQRAVTKTLKRARAMLLAQ